MRGKEGKQKTRLRATSGNRAPREIAATVPDERNGCEKVVAKSYRLAGNALESDGSIQDAFSQNQTALQSSLGESDYAELRNFESEESNRQIVDSLTNGMRAKNVDVPPDLQEAILAAYTDAVGEASKANSVPNSPSSDAAESKKEQDNRFYKLLLEKESPLMSHDQLDALMQSALEQ